MVANSLMVTPGFMQPSQWDMMNQQAEVLVKSGFLPKDVNTPQKAIAIMMVGQELGILPWQALSTINVIQGKPTVSPQLMLGLIQRSGQLENISIDGSATQCVVTMKRKGQDAHTETFTIEDAAKLGLSGKDNYKKQPATMLKWRAVAACARTVFPDVVLGLYTPEEMGAEVAVSDTGEQVVVETPAPQLAIVTPPAPEVTEGEIVEDAPPAKPVAEEPRPDEAPELIRADMENVLQGIEYKIEPNTGGFAQVVLKDKANKRDAVERVSAMGFKVTKNIGTTNWFDTDLRIYAEPH